MTMDVDLIVVTYNSAHVLASLLDNLPATVNTVVVDNASSDETGAVAAAAGAKFIRNDQNIGYGGACNVGAAAGQATFLLFANPDMQFEAGAIEALLAAAASHPDAAFNPYLRSGARRRFRRWSRLLPKSESWQGPAPVADCTIPVLSGACIFVRRAHFERIGGFDTDIFLFHEDDDLSLRLRQSGVDLRIACKAVADHSEGDSSARSVESGRIKGEAMGRSLAYVMRKHKLPLNVSAELRRSYLKLLLPHVLFNTARRAKLRGFMRGLRGRAK